MRGVEVVVTVSYTDACELRYRPQLMLSCCSSVTGSITKLCLQRYTETDSDLTVQQINPFTADLVKALHSAILV